MTKKSNLIVTWQALHDSIRFIDYLVVALLLFGPTCIIAN